MTENLKNHFKEYSISEFFKKNKHMLGFTGKIKNLTMIIHEYVTNALDACEEAGTLPTIKIEIKDYGDYYKVIVQDNGPGLPKELIGKAFGQMLTGTKFHRYMQQRGQQGIGAAGCTMYGIISTGKPVHVISFHNGTAISCDLTIDLKNNKPIIKNIIEKPTALHGLIIEGYFGEVKFDKGQYGVLEYLKRTALVNPHADIELRFNNEVYHWKRTSNIIPPKPKEIKPHPLGIETHDLLELAKQSPYKKLSTFLINELDRVSYNKVKEIQEFSKINLDISPKELTWEQANAIIKTIKNMKWSAPRMDSIIPIGKEVLEKSVNAILKPEYVYVVERSPKVYRGGIPYLVEVAIAYGKTIEEFKSNIMRFANRVPLLFDTSACALTKAVKSIDWKHYGIKSFENEPIAVVVSLSSVYIPYISTGKQAIADIEEISKELKNAIMEAARGIKRYLSKKSRQVQIEKRKKALLRYVNKVSEDLSYLSSEDKTQIKIMLENIIKRI